MRKHLTIITMAALWASQAYALELDNDEKRFSYIIGLQIGQQLKNDKIELDEPAFMAAIKDVYQDKTPQLSQSEMDEAMQRVQQKRLSEVEKAAGENLNEGQKFLTANKSKSGVKTTDSGLQYKVVKEGKGAAPKATDTVEVHYRGTLIDGTEFDSSYERGQPASFPVNGVIKGWQEALQLMKEGAVWKVYIPSELGYGSRGAGGKIGPNAALIFDVELLKIKNK